MIQVLLNNEGTEEGSLLKLLNRAVTPFGAFFLPVFYSFSWCQSRQAAFPDLALHAFERNF
jgi:hypothetical protein